MTMESMGRPIELLLVEDNYGDVLLTREACSESHNKINLSVASDGEEAMERLLRKGRFASEPRPDLVLLDLNLPRMDGREVLAAIKSDPTLQRIPVIVLTSSAAEIDVLRSYDLKANSYIVKPVEFDGLQHVIASIECFWFAVAALPSAFNPGA